MNRPKTDRALFLPDLCGLRPLFLIVVVGELIAIILTLAMVGVRMSAFQDFALISLFTQWVGLSAAAALCLARSYLMRFSEQTAVVLSYALIMAVVWVVAEIAWWIAGTGSAAAIISLDRPDFILRVIMVTAIVAALVLRYFFVQYHWRQQTIAEAEARLDALQARIRPHFLFNCMNTIASLTRSNPATAERAIEDLADLFRASMSDARTIVSLAEEFDLVERYVGIEALRLGDRLKIDWSIDDITRSQKIPMLSIQPLVENAIYHGIEPLPSGGVIRISAERHNDTIVVRVSNPVTDDTVPRHKGNQIARDNIRQRLQAHYGDAATIEIEPVDDQYCLRVSVPDNTTGDMDD